MARSLSPTLSTNERSSSWRRKLQCHHSMMNQLQRRRTWLPLFLSRHTIRLLALVTPSHRQTHQATPWFNAMILILSIPVAEIHNLESNLLLSYYVTMTPTELASISLSLSLVWAAIYALHYLLAFSARRTLLPTTNISRHRLPALTPAPSKWVLKRLHLRFESFSWNASHDALSVALARRRNPWSKHLKFLYNIGSITCCLSMIGSLAVLSAALWQLISLLWTTLLYDSLSETPSKMLVRRSLSALVPAHTSPEPISPVLKPIVCQLSPLSLCMRMDISTLTDRPQIPGLTVPLSHLPLALVALFITQFIHEIGHAVSAALFVLQRLHR